MHTDLYVMYLHVHIYCIYITQLLSYFYIYGSRKRMWFFLPLLEQVRTQTIETVCPLLSKNQKVLRFLILNALLFPYAYIHTYIHTYIYTYFHSLKYTYIHTWIDNIWRGARCAQYCRSEVPWPIYRNKPDYSSLHQPSDDDGGYIIGCSSSREQREPNLFWCEENRRRHQGKYYSCNI